MTKKIAALQRREMATVAQMQAILDIAAADGDRDLDNIEAEQYNALVEENNRINAQLKPLVKLDGGPSFPPNHQQGSGVSGPEFWESSTGAMIPVFSKQHRISDYFKTQMQTMLELEEEKT